jgi:hypothetical protein
MQGGTPWRSSKESEAGNRQSGCFFPRHFVIFLPCSLRLRSTIGDLERGLITSLMRAVLSWESRGTSN